ncbi:MAG: hypothetical protein PVJ63_06335 [Thioalkalispiraceae bacterium]|jgi:hypothetical protein
MPDLEASPQSIIAQWCNTMSRSVTRRDIHEHMSQISDKLHVYGVPGYQQLTFYDWAKRREYEFSHNLLDSLTYKLLKIKSTGLRRIQFHAEETMRATSGKVIILYKDITLERPTDQSSWQSIEETILDWQGEE